MKRIWKEYFTFSKKERVAVILLLLLMAAFLAAPYFYRVKPEPVILNKALADFMLEANTKPTDSFLEASPDLYPEKKGFPKPALFPFDPNTINEEGWGRLGIPARTIHTIINYRNKGGRFRSPEDIRKIWGLKKEKADALVPFVQIGIPAGSSGYPVKKADLTPPPPRQIISFDINTATPDQWKTLPGIGEVLANRIVRFRDKMGGFVSVEQVSKTYGISDSVFRLINPWLKVNSATLPKVNLNTASVYDLSSKANVPYEIARAIINYRRQYGLYQSLHDLKKISSIPDTVYQKLLLCLKIE